jgi:hypothetical protein
MVPRPWPSLQQFDRIQGLGSLWLPVAQLEPGFSFAASGGRPTPWAAAGWLFFRVARSAHPAPFLRRLRNGHTRKRQKWGGMGASLAP